MDKQIHNLNGILQNFKANHPQYVPVTEKHLQMILQHNLHS